MGVVIGEGPGVGQGVGVGEGMGITRVDTFQIHVCIAVPFSLYASAVMFHIPTMGLVFV